MARLRRPSLLAVCLLILVAIVLGARSTRAADTVERFRDDRDGAAAAALGLARRAFDAYVLRRERISVPEDLPPLLGERSGVFVSGAIRNAPRCCMGSLHPTRKTLAEEIIAAAVAAAGLDARRKPIKPEELDRIQLVVSVVAPPEAIDAPRLLDPKAEGLAVRSAHGVGVVLPGETPHLELMLRWARIRGRATPDERVDHFRVRAFRVAEPPEP